MERPVNIRILSNYTHFVNFILYHILISNNLQSMMVNLCIKSWSSLNIKVFHY